MPMLDANNCCLLVIDVQEKLYGVMHQKEVLADHLEKLIRAMRILEVPVMVTEQYPQGIGQTIVRLSALLEGFPVLSKIHFSCCGDPIFLKKFQELNRRQVLIVGIECHVCVHQTAVDLLDRGYRVQIVADGVSSRTAQNRDIGLQKMRDEGAMITSTETVVFELLKAAGSDKFREISKIIK
jgi:nicotinamidase-related amidase